MISDTTFEVLELLSKDSFFKENEIFLVGGTAIAFHAKHRTSYDLDFSVLNYSELPDLSFLKKYNAEKIDFDNFTQDSIKNEGGEVNELHQRFTIKGVKVEFFCPFSKAEKEILRDNENCHYKNNIVIAPLDTLFKMKVITLFDRNKIRDLYDVVYLVKNYKYTAKEMIETIQKYKYENMFDFPKTIKLMDTILKDRKPNQDDLDFEGIHNEVMQYGNYEDLKNI